MLAKADEFSAWFGTTHNLLHTVKSRAVDRSTIQFWTLLAKGHSTQGSNFPFIKSQKILGRATNWDVLLLATLWYFKNLYVGMLSVVNYLYAEYVLYWHFYRLTRSHKAIICQATSVLNLLNALWCKDDICTMRMWLSHNQLFSCAHSITKDT